MKHFRKRANGSVETYHNACIAYLESGNKIITLESLMHVQKAFSLVYVCGWHHTADGVFNLVLLKLQIAIN